MLNNDQLQWFTLALAAGTFLVSLIMLAILLRRNKAAQAGQKMPAYMGPGSQSPARFATEDQQIAAVITAAIMAAQADDRSDFPLAAAIAGAVYANRAGEGNTAGFVIRKIRRV